MTWEKKSLNELKAHLKKCGLSQTGDKGTLVYRCGLYEKCTLNNLLVDGKNPCSLKLPELRKAVSVLGISPIGNQDELLSSIVDYLYKNNCKAQATEPKNEPNQNIRQEVDPIEIARKVLQLDETDDYEGFLNIAGGGLISKQSPINMMRKAYLKISLLIHPDKLGRSFEQATKAFQALVRAFERLSTPDALGTDEENEGSEKKNGARSNKKSLKIARSNEGCFRTRVCCPRCKQPWSEGTLDGNPDYFYNFMMMGLKQYTCSTCLFEFGCITAIHRCPFCKGQFEYSPQVL